MKKLIYSFVLAAFFLAACKNSNTTATTESKPTSEVVAAPSETEITISGDDQMKFDTDAITVPAGKKVKLTLVHTGKLAKEAMGHNWVLLKPGIDPQEFAGAAMKAKESDYIPESRVGDVIAHTDLIGGGESTTITFDAPEAGMYEFICSFPGHSGMMKGVFIVE